MLQARTKYSASTLQAFLSTKYQFFEVLREVFGIFLPVVADAGNVVAVVDHRNDDVAAAVADYLEDNRSPWIVVVALDNEIENLYFALAILAWPNPDLWLGSQGSKFGNFGFEPSHFPTAHKEFGQCQFGVPTLIRVAVVAV